MFEREEMAIGNVVARLCDAFPHVPEPRIRACVHEIMADFAHARIRDYLPILVERGARGSLADFFVTPEIPRPRRPAAAGEFGPVVAPVPR